MFFYLNNENYGIKLMFNIKINSNNNIHIDNNNFGTNKFIENKKNK